MFHSSSTRVMEYHARKARGPPQAGTTFIGRPCRCCKAAIGLGPQNVRSLQPRCGCCWRSCCQSRKKTRNDAATWPVVLQESLLLSSWTGFDIPPRRTEYHIEGETPAQLKEPEQKVGGLCSHAFKLSRAASRTVPMEKWVGC